MHMDDCKIPYDLVSYKPLNNWINQTVGNLIEMPLIGLYLEHTL